MRNGPVTGLLGGSFNPAHGGHRRISLFALDALALDDVWWLVSPGNVLKPVAGMAPLAARVSAARVVARRAPIRVTAIEAQLDTRYTVDTLRALLRRYPKRRFVWLMGADNLAQFHRWRDWRGIARMLPIAVIARPGYDAAAVASPAMAWLRRFRRRPGRLVNGATWSAPALTILRFDPDSRSATQLRAVDPDWPSRHLHRVLRDPLTHRPLLHPLTTDARP
ncbi:nicotinate-nucleotide adenylyltransferase [Novosphingobium lentum]|uniref:nicotinate-nucleotide adenylyltransferase n=1 Tax=Novosphingobium lentum TaxID=145287 RepID=UPI00082E04F5|nr:nicotinate-nucleotide adenylyltransferase [Novosphingobium lentum]